MKSALLIGYGNPGRLDDGLGPAFADAVQTLSIPGLTVDSDYQLTVEDAVELASHDLVVFADADVSGPEPFYVKRLLPEDSPALGFSSHSVGPKALLSLAKELFACSPECYLIGIRGYEFDEFGERISERAQRNLKEAVLHFSRSLLEGGHLSELRADEIPNLKLDE